MIDVYPVIVTHESLVNFLSCKKIHEKYKSLNIWKLNIIHNNIFQCFAHQNRYNLWSVVMLYCLYLAYKSSLLSDYLNR